MKRVALAVCVLALSFLAVGRAEAHFGMVIPSDPMIQQGEGKSLALKLSFSHPFEGIGMEMARPRGFAVIGHGQRTDLLDRLKESRVMGHRGWQVDFRAPRPGAYTFAMEPEPYWEPAEDCYIVHYTKTAVAAFGDDEGWDAELGLKTEIVPLTRPFGLYAGNVFQGIVKKDGLPVPFAEVEVEFYNQDGKRRAPNDLMVTQAVKADSSGVFTYAAPWPGWWGFAALSSAEYTLARDGEEKEVELGAVIWVRFERAEAR